MEIKKRPKKFFTWKKAAISTAGLALIAAFLYPQYTKHIEKSRKESVELLLQQIVLAQMSLTALDCCIGYCPSVYVYTDGVHETPETAVMKYVQEQSFYCDDNAEYKKYCFRPDPSFAFHVMGPEPTVDGGFIAFAARNSVGSTVYLYNYNTVNGVEVAREGVGYSFSDVDIAIDFSKVTLYRYKYGPNNKDNPVVRLPGQVKIGPDLKDVSPRRMIVIEAAK